MGPKPTRYQHQRCVHFITFSCYRRMPLLNSAAARDIFEHELERVRCWYGCYITGYVVMPEHVHLLISEPERSELSVVIQMLKQITSRKLKSAAFPRFWQIRYYDFPVWTEKKRIEKLRYIHRNPVKRGLVARPEDWPWSSFVHYATGTEGAVEIESQWTARKRERISTTENYGSRDIVRVKTYGDILREYEFHPEAKCADADGNPCGKQTVGLLRRRRIRISEIRYIGKESNFLEDVEAGMLHSPHLAYTEYPDKRRDEWEMIILPALKNIPLAELIVLSGMSPSQLKEIRAGRSRPHPGNQERLAQVARERRSKSKVNE